MVIKREWAMPDQWTFRIKPIAELLNRYVGDGKGWIDPFAGMNSPAEFTNDINPDSPSMYHLKAIDFCKNLDGIYNGILFDPPYSLRQVKECYDNFGADLTYEETITYFSRLKAMMSSRIKFGGLAICCGWNSGGFGISNGFDLIEVLLVPHGRDHNDTIVTVERKIKTGLLI